MKASRCRWDNDNELLVSCKSSWSSEVSGPKMLTASPPAFAAYLFRHMISDAASAESGGRRRAFTRHFGHPSTYRLTATMRVRVRRKSSQSSYLNPDTKTQARGQQRSPIARRFKFLRPGRILTLPRTRDSLSGRFLISCYVPLSPTLPARCGRVGDLRIDSGRCGTPRRRDFDRQLEPG